MREKLLIVLAAVALTDGVWAQAQADVTYNGNWAATVVSDSGVRRQSRLVIKEFGGTWYGKVPAVTNGKRPCGGTRFPVTVQTSNDTNLDFTVWGSAVGPACRDLSITLKPTAKDVFEGDIESGGTLKLVRSR